VPRFSVDGEAVLAASATATATIPRVQADVAALLASLTALENSWGGTAATAFQSVVAEWRATQQRVDEVLLSITQALAAAGRQYLDVEHANARMFAR